MCQSTGYFELQLVSVDNPRGQLLNGDCCDAEKSAAEGECGADECDTYLRVCLKEYQTEVSTNGPCTYGSETTKVIGGNTFQFKGGQKTGQNRNHDAGKIAIAFQFAWPVSGASCFSLFAFTWESSSLCLTSLSPTRGSLDVLLVNHAAALNLSSPQRALRSA